MISGLPDKISNEIIQSNLTISLELNWKQSITRVDLSEPLSKVYAETNPSTADKVDP